MTSVDMNRLSQFVKVVDAGGISRAARSLSVPKSIVSRNLALLEQEIGQQLVYRTTRQFHLTESGALLFESAKASMAEIERSLEALRQANQELSGSIKITIPDDLGIHILIPAITSFKKLYPQVSFEIIYTSDLLDLVANGIDMAVRAGNLVDSSLKRQAAGKIELILVASPELLKNLGKVTTIEQLAAMPTVGFSTKDKMTVWNLQKNEQKAKVKTKPMMIANNFIAIRDMVLQGHGIGFIPTFLCEPYLQSGDLIRLLKPWRNEGDPVQIVMPAQKAVPKRIRTFSDYLVKKLLSVFGTP